MGSLGRRRDAAVLLVVLMALGGCVQFTPPSGGAPDTLHAAGTAVADPGTAYYPENDTGRYPALRAGAEREEYWTASFEEYASWKCGDVAVERIDQFVQKQIDNKSLIVGYGVDDEGAVDIGYLRSADRERVDERLPNRVETTVEMFNRTHTCTVPVTLDPSSTAVPLDVS